MRQWKFQSCAQDRSQRRLICGLKSLDSYILQLLFAMAGIKNHAQRHPAKPIKPSQSISVAKPYGALDRTATLLGGSWVVISGVISRVTVLTTHIKGLITLLITTHEPPSSPLTKAWCSRVSPTRRCPQPETCKGT